MLAAHYQAATGSACAMRDGLAVQLPRLQVPTKKKSKKVHSANPGSRKQSVLQTKYRELVDEILQFQPKFGTTPGIKHLGVASVENLPSSLSGDYRIASPKPALTPATKKVYRTSKREQFHRRKDMQHKPVIVLGFEGLVGDVFKTNLWVNGPSKLYLRKDSVRSIKTLRKAFQVVLFLHSNRVILSKLLDVFEKRKVRFDAVYRSNSAKLHQVKPSKKQSIAGKHKLPLKYSQYVQDYTQIALDFQIQLPESQLLVVSSLELSIDELTNSQSTECIYSMERHCPRFLV